MMVVVSYDVNTLTKEGRRRLRHVAKICESYGQRVQLSVFECLVDPEQFIVLKDRLLEEYNPSEDSLRFYFLGKNWRNRVEHKGSKVAVDIEGPLIV
jgi:CRISPR-associated protein Cas2